MTDLTEKEEQICIKIWALTMGSSSGEEPKQEPDRKELDAPGQLVDLFAPPPTSARSADDHHVQPDAATPQRGAPINQPSSSTRAQQEEQKSNIATTGEDDSPHVSPLSSPQGVESRSTALTGLFTPLAGTQTQNLEPSSQQRTEYSLHSHDDPPSSPLPPTRWSSGLAWGGDNETTTLLGSVQKDSSQDEDESQRLYGYDALKASSQQTVTFAPRTNEARPLSQLRHFFGKHFQPTTFAGAFMFLLYHVVFCLANGSAITRPHHSILGFMAKQSCVGILFAGPVYIWKLGPDIPALYPSIDLFLAPLLAQAAAVVDASLRDDDSDAVFFGTFAVLTAIGMFLAGSLLYLAATFKLANLGTYLPYSVLCGFFSAVGYVRHKATEDDYDFI